jgi:hypothetical protein
VTGTRAGVIGLRTAVGVLVALALAGVVILAAGVPTVDVPVRLEP